MTRNPQGNFRYYFIIGGQKVHYYETIIQRLFNNKSIQNYKPTPPAEEKCIDIFNDFLIEVILLYGFLGGYAVSELIEKQQKAVIENKKENKYIKLSKKNKIKTDSVLESMEILQANIEQNTKMVEQLREYQKKNEELEQKIKEIQNEKEILKKQHKQQTENQQKKDES